MRLVHRAYLVALKASLRAVLGAAYRFEIELPPDWPAGPAVVVCNHVSFHDWAFLAAGLPGAPRFVMHHYHFRFPALRTFFRLGRVIPISPRKEAPEVLAAAMAAIDDALAAGDVVVLYPEGTMSPDGEVGAFRPGVSRIVAKHGVPVVPARLDGLWGSWFSRRHGPPMSGWPRRFRAAVRLRVGAALPAAEVGRARDAVLRLADPMASASVAPTSDRGWVVSQNG